jgi:NAD(P)-dependent dehydrogenase (short-subunit alcohol dehydrogenase family)
MCFQRTMLNEHHIVISGGCGAIGLGLVKSLVSHGARVTVNDVLTEEEAERRLSEAEIDPSRVVYHKADLTADDQTASLLAFARAHFGPVDTALCHAGVVISGPLVHFSAADWNRTISTNLTSAFLLGKHAASQMIEENRKGQLVFTSSWVSETPWPDIGPYNASKAGMNQLMRSFARELAPRGIRANAIAPGLVAIGMAKMQYETDPAYRARALKAIPLGYMQPLDSVVNGFLFLCSPAAQYMCGSVLFIDGGCSLYPMD